MVWGSSTFVRTINTREEQPETVVEEEFEEEETKVKKKAMA
jgi:hypothetical protein